MNTVFQKIAEITDDFDAMRGSIKNALNRLYEMANVLDNLGYLDSMGDTKLTIKVMADFSVKSVNGVEKICLEYEHRDTFTTYYPYDKDCEYFPTDDQNLSLKLENASFKKLVQGEFSLVDDSTSWSFVAVIRNGEDSDLFFLSEILFNLKSNHEMGVLLQSLTTSHFTHFALCYGDGEEYSLPLAKDFIKEHTEHNHWDAKTIDVWDTEPSAMLDFYSKLS